jgi:antitoxin component of MazEF toxin-antitoxin module
MLMHKFVAKVTKSGKSKVVVIPHLIADDFEFGEKVKVTIEKV